jgi:hypothetical protein
LAKSDAHVVVAQLQREIERFAVLAQNLSHLAL